MADVFRAVQAAKKNAETRVSEAEYTLLMGRLSGRDFDLIQRAIDAALAEQPAQKEMIPQYRKRGCTDWYDGYADHEDGRGPYQERIVYTAQPATTSTVSAACVPDDVAKDAARYRWLREKDNASSIVQGYLHTGTSWLPRRSKLDAIIDAAMLAAAPEMPS